MATYGLLNSDEGKVQGYCGCRLEGEQFIETVDWWY